MPIGEKEKLELEVDRFAIDMKDVLIEKMEEGYYGWDDSSNVDIIRQKAGLNLSKAMIEMDTKGYTAEARKKLIHAANCCMFLSRFCD